MKMKVIVPPIGESITEGILVEWLKGDGETVAQDEPLFVLETDKVTMTINAEAGGRLSIDAREGETVQIGQVVATLDPEAVGGETPSAGSPSPAEGVAEESPPISPSAGMEQLKSSLEKARTGDLPLSPSVRRMIEEHNLSPDEIRGTGRGGRLRKEDVIHHLQTSEEATEERPGGSDTPPPGLPSAAQSRDPEERQTRHPMTPLRRRVAERMVEAQRSAAILSTFNEADMTAVVSLRARHRERFKKRYGVDLGLMSFFVKASVEALKTVPSINAFIEGSDILQNHYYDIGIAVGSERGLVVPVIRDADLKSFAEIELSIADYVTRIEERTITLDELQGAVFSISNGGVFGSLLSTPLLNPPQSGILGMHAIKKRPVAVEDRMEIRPMMYLALSYDHRLIDGREAVTFLRRIVECIENPERMMLEI